MPKISVHLEADSAEEFQALLAAFSSPPANWYSFKTTEPKVETPSAPIEQTKPEQASTRTKEEAPEPVAVRVPEPEVEQAVATAPQEPTPARRGRPRKEKPAEAAPAAEASVVPAVAEPEPVKAKPKPMAHALPENGAVSRQDLLDAFSEYVQRYGASFGFSDISQLLQKNLGDGVRKASDVPEDLLHVAIGAIKTAIADNPFNRKRDYA